MIPKLDFPTLTYGKFETPWDLAPLLYSGGAATNSKKIRVCIALGELGPPMTERVVLVQKIHEYLESKLVAGGSRGTAHTTIRRIREFFSWADLSGLPVSIESLEADFVQWSESLLQRHRIVGDISQLHAYQCAVAVAKIFDDILELTNGLISKTRLNRPKHNSAILGTEADKQNINEVFGFGQMLLDITDALSVASVWGPLPVSIRFRSGQVFDDWSQLRAPELLKTLRQNVKPSTRNDSMAKRVAWEAETSLRTRRTLINLRIEAEILIFVAQTGMNLEQVYLLKFSKFRYRSHLTGYQVHRVYKGRRHGEVEFTIFSQYKDFFERYLEWKKAIFPGEDEGLLFPLLTLGRLWGPPSFSMVRVYCKKLGIRFIATRDLRKTRINWLLRRSKDPEMVAEMHAHTQETLIRQYARPSLQIAITEICRFHTFNDPSISPPGPGLCIEAIPVAVDDAPAEAPTPDCVSPAGCLFCVHHRDIDSEDHVWSLVSYRYLKSLELRKYRPPIDLEGPHPAAASIERLSQKLVSFEDSSPMRKNWVDEAVARANEGSFHPRWDGFILVLEART